VGNGEQRSRGATGDKGDKEDRGDMRECEEKGYCWFEMLTHLLMKRLDL
jgi:hypothetical protein